MPRILIPEEKGVGKQVSVKEQVQMRLTTELARRAEKNPLAFAKKLTGKERELFALRTRAHADQPPPGPVEPPPEPPRLDDRVRDMIAARAFAIGAMPMDVGRRADFEQRLKTNDVLNEEINHGIGAGLQRLIWAGRWGKVAVAYTTEFISCKLGAQPTIKDHVPTNGPTATAPTGAADGAIPSTGRGTETGEGPTGDSSGQAQTQTDPPIGDNLGHHQLNDGAGGRVLGEL